MRKTIYSFLTLAMFLLAAQVSNASHFRYGDISWRVDDNDATGRTIEFRVNTGWRCCPYVALNYGGNVPQTLTGTANGAEYYTGTTTHTFTSNGTYRVYYSGGAKIGNLQNNANGSWYVYTDVNVGTGNNSPVTSLPAIVNVQVGLPQAKFFVPAADPDGDNLSFRLASSADSWPGTQPSGISIDANTGEITWDTQGKAIGQLWNAAVIISDDNGSEILVDFIMQITQQSNPPQFDYSITPADGFSYQTSPGQTITFPVEAYDTDAGSTVSMFASGMPTGATVSPSFGTTANPINHVFSWTPTSTQFGQYLINFTAQDNNGVQVATSVSINVSLKPVFDVPPTPAAGVHNTVVSPGTLIQYTVQASDPDPLDVVQIISIEGKSHMGATIPIYAGATLTPLPTTSGNPTSGTFSWTPTQAQWGHRHVYFTAEDSYGDQTVHEVNQLVNTPPVFSSSPVLTADAGQPYSYTINVTDPDLPYGDVLTIFGITLPSWLSVTDNGDGTATLSGTPTIADAGSNSITIQAEDLHHHDDPRGVIQQLFNIEVSVCQPITFSNSFNLVECVGGTTIFNYVVSGGNAPYSITDQNGGTLNAAAAEATSYTASLGAGNYSFYITDANGCMDTADVVIGQSDVTLPTALAQDVSVFIGPMGTAMVTAADVDNGSSDNCGIASLSVSPNTFDCTNVGINPVVLTVTDVNGNVATATANVDVQLNCTGNIDLNTWTQEGNPGAGNWSVAADGSSVFQSINGSPTFYVSPDTFYNTVIEGGFGVQTTSDDDFIGFVLGYNSPNSSTANNVYDMLLFDWKQGAQAGAPQGMRLTRIQGTSTDEFGTFWGKNTSASTILGTNTSLGGWADNTNYDFRVEYTATNVKVWIDGTQVFDVNGSFSPGRFGFYNYSQSSVQYQGFIQPFSTVVNSTNASCPGASDGSATATPTSGGVAPFTYEWSTGDSTTSVSGLAAGTYSVVITAANCCVDTAEFTILDVDTESPNAQVQDITVYLDASGNAAIAATDIDNGSTDNCGISSLSINNNSFTCNEVGSNPITLTVTDNSGNSSTATSNVTVIDSVSPAASAQDVTVYLDASGNASIVAADVDNGSSDICGIASLSVSPSAFTCANVGANTVTLTAIDNNGNSSTATATVTVVDNVNPNAIAQDLDVYLDASGNASITAADIDNGSNDNCSIVSTTIDITSFDCSNTDRLSTVTLTVTDASGNVSTATSKVEVFDTIAPIAIAQDITVYLDANGSASITALDIDNGSNDACGIISTMIDATTFGCSNVGGNTVVLSVEDDNGNISTATATVTVVDNMNPNVVAQNVTVYLDAAGNGSITTADVDNGSSDNCGIASLSLDNTNFNCASVNGGGIQIVSDSTWALSSVADSSNSLSFPWPGAALVPAASTFTLAVELGQPYSYTTINAVPGSDIIKSNTHVRYYRKTFNLSSLAGISARIRASFDDDMEVYINGHLVAGEYSFSQSSFQGTPHDLLMDGSGSVNGNNGGDQFGFVTSTTIDNILTVGTNEIILALRNRQGGDRGGVSFVMDVNGSALGNTVVLTATDVNGNSASASASVTVVDTVAPVISQMPTSFTAYTTQNDCTPPVYWQLPLADDACSVQSFVGTNHPGDHFPVGVTTVTYTATDVNGNMTAASFDVTVIDNEAPTVLGQDISVSLDATGSASITLADVDNGSFDACGIDTAYIDVTSFACANVGPNNVTITMTDIYGNTATQTVVVTVVDDMAPNAIAQDATVYLDANGNGSITVADIDNGSNDNCGIASITVSPTTFDCSDVLGDNVLSIVSDSLWMESTMVDSTTSLTFPWAGAPFVPAANTFTLPVELGQPYNFTTINPIPGSDVIKSHTHIRFYRKTFPLNSLNELSARIRMSVDDDMEIYINGHLLAGEYSFSQSSFQGVPHDLYIDSTGVYNGYNGGDTFGYVDSMSLANLFVAGTNEIIVAVRNRVGNDRGGFTLVMDVNADFPGNPVVLTVTDVNGNTSQDVGIVTVVDTVAPVISQVPTSFTAYTLSDDCTPPVYWTLPVASDACNVQSLLGTYHPGDHFPVGVTTVTYTALDVSGNTTTASFDVTVVDTTAPTTICQNITVNLDATGNASIVAADIDNGSYDACGIASSTINTSNFSCADVGTNMVTLTNTDIYGNSSTCTAMVTVVDVTAPQAICQNITVALDASGNASIVAADIDNGSNDVCGIADLIIDNSTFSCANVGSNTVTLTVIDNNGNSSTCQAQVTVIDTIAPVALASDITVNLDVNGNASITPADIDNGSNDACGIAAYDVVPNTFGCAELGMNVVTFTVTDNNGNMSTVLATVNVQESYYVDLEDMNDISEACNTSIGGKYISWDEPTAGTFSSCSPDTCTAGTYIPGFTYMGVYNGHRYFRSTSHKYTWSEADAAATALGGHLAVINDAGENHFLACQSPGYFSWIGLSDASNEGNFTWINGDPLTFTKWNNPEPNNRGGRYCGPGGSDYAVLKKWTGRWYDRTECSDHAFIMEMPCGNDVVINQISGPASGSKFTTGTTTVTYVANDTVTGATDTTSFDVTIGECVPEYCSINGNSNYEWINRVKLGSIDNTSGNDGGYGDYSSMIANVTTGDWVSLTLYPGFANKKYKEYWTVYVDWNNDGDFNDYKECVYTAKSKNTKSGSFKVPSWAFQGDVRVRVVMRWGGYGGSCGNCGYGEAEDYTLSISGMSGSWKNTSSSADNGSDVNTDQIIFQEAFDLYPNPAVSGQTVTVGIRSAIGQETELNIFSSTGQLVYTETVALREGLNAIEVKLQNLRAGTYFMKSGNQTEAIPFVVK